MNEVADTTPVCEVSYPFSFSLLVDNSDNKVIARYIRVDNQWSKLLYLFHLCAVRDRITSVICHGWMFNMQKNYCL